YLFARYLDVHSKIICRFQILDHGIGKVMNIDDYVVNAEFTQARKRDFQECSAGNFDKRLGTIIGERPQTRTKARGQYHGFHFPRVSSPMCRTTTSTPDFSR